jgi:hypothetical protein
MPVGINTGRVTRTITTDENGSYIPTQGQAGKALLNLAINDNQTTYFEVSNIQLEKGSATTYEPYQEQDYEVNLGKNLLDIAAGTHTDAGVVYSKGNGTTSAIGTTTRAASAQAMNLVGAMVSHGNYPSFGTITEGNSLALPSGTYTLSATISNTGNTNGGLFIGVGNVGSQPASYERLSETGSKSITLADGQRFYLSIWYEGTSTNKNVDLSVSNIQLEQGSTATSYAPYFTPIELAKIGTYQDRIYKDGEKWYVEKQIKKYVFDGSESWSLFSNKLHTFKTGLGTDRAQNGICDHFVRGYASDFDVVPCFYASNTAVAIFSYPDMADATAFATWLASNPTTVYYALATPTVTEITDQTLIDQLEALASAALNQGVNNIWTEIATGNAMPTLELNWVEWEKYNRHNVYIWNDDIDDWQVIVS